MSSNWFNQLFRARVVPIPGAYNIGMSVLRVMAGARIVCMIWFDVMPGARTFILGVFSFIIVVRIIGTDEH